jgi:hypothetical protein
MVFTLQGVFKDGKEAFNPSSTDCKFFVRNFAVVPRGDRFFPQILSDGL